MDRKAESLHGLEAELLGIIVAAAIISELLTVFLFSAFSLF